MGSFLCIILVEKALVYHAAFFGVIWLWTTPHLPLFRSHHQPRRHRTLPHVALVARVLEKGVAFAPGQKPTWFTFLTIFSPARCSNSVGRKQGSSLLSPSYTSSGASRHHPPFLPSISASAIHLSTWTPLISLASFQRIRRLNTHNNTFLRPPLLHLPLTGKH